MSDGGWALLNVGVAVVSIIGMAVAYVIGRSSR